jgi:hypothetical protein
MTADYKLDAMFEIRRYFWDQLQSIGIFDEADYYTDGVGSVVVPIIPVQQSPELNQFLSGKKHIVYDKISSTYDTNWMICNEQLLFTIYSVNVSEVNEIRNFMTDLFRRMDESARDINRWAEVSDKFKFHSIYISDISPTTPSEELQGFLSTDVILDVKYSRITDSVGRFL